MAAAERGCPSTGAGRRPGSFGCRASLLLLRSAMLLGTACASVAPSRGAALAFVGGSAGPHRGVYSAMGASSRCSSSLRASESGSDHGAQESRSARGHGRKGLVSRDGLLHRVLLGGGAAAGLASMGGALPAGAVSVEDSDLPRTSYRTKSGVRYYDVREGTGPSPKWGQVCLIHYEGFCRATPGSRLVLFDDTYTRNLPYILKHGNGRVIRGLDEGMHSMKLGGLRRIVVPLSLGFTRVGLGPVPPNALRRKILVRELNKAEESTPPGELVFDVELVSVYDDEADLGYYEDLTFEPQYFQEGLAKALQELRDAGVKIPTTKAFQTKPEIFAKPDVGALPDVM